MKSEDTASIIHLAMVGITACITIAVGVFLLLAALLLLAYWVITRFYKPQEIKKTKKETEKSQFDKLNGHIDAAQKKILEGQDPQVNEGNTNYDHTNEITVQGRNQVMQALDNAIGKFLQNITGETAQTQKSIQNSVKDARTQFEMRQKESSNAVAECSGEVVEKVGTGEVENDISSVKVRVCKWFISCRTQP